MLESILAILGLEKRSVRCVTIRIPIDGVVEVEVEEYMDRSADEPLATELRKYELVRRPRRQE